MASSNESLCGVCKQQERKYQCPRCNIFYCSIECYKDYDHSLCSEEFFKECIQNEISSFGGTGDSENERKMLEILKRCHEEEVDDTNDDLEELDSDDDASEDDLAERLKDVDLDDTDEIWMRLTDEEKQQFTETLKSNIIDLIPEFKPWWEFKDDRKVLDEESILKIEKEIEEKCPVINLKNIPRINSPASCVCYNISNVLGAYSFMVRHCGGDHSEFSYDSTLSIITLSKNLLKKENFSDFDSAIKSVFLEILGTDYLKGSIDSSEIIRSDVIRIFEGPFNSVEKKNIYVVSALSDIHRLFSKCIEHYKKGKQSIRQAPANNAVSECKFSNLFPDSGFTLSCNIPKSEIRNCLKKIEYFLSWAVNCYQMPSFESV